MGCRCGGGKATIVHRAKIEHDRLGQPNVGEVTSWAGGDVLKTCGDLVVLVLAEAAGIWFGGEIGVAGRVGEALNAESNVDGSALSEGGVAWDGGEIV